MDIEDIIKICTGTTAEHWYVVRDWERGFGDKDHHHSRAVFRRDVSLAIEWGMVEEERLDLPYTKPFADETVSSQFIDVKYNGLVVFREVAVLADGGRYHLPAASRKSGGASWVVTEWEVTLTRLVHDLAGGDRDFMDGMRQAGLEVIVPNRPES